MYFERIEKRLKIMEEIRDRLTEGQTGSLLIKGTSSVLIVKKRAISNLNIKQNPKIVQIIRTFDF